MAGDGAGGPPGAAAVKSVAEADRVIAYWFEGEPQSNVRRRWFVQESDVDTQVMRRRAICSPASYCCSLPLPVFP